MSQASGNGLSVDEVAALATRLAASGARLTPRGRRTADLASTGGPTSLSTLLCPPMLAAAGWDVPKLGVPGRPAGGVDVLAGIRGYGVCLDADAAAAVLARCGYVHVDAGATFAPEDAALFRYRQSVGAQAVVDLAIASLLSKKLAMGVRRVGLEVRVAPHGNFGNDLTTARAAAVRFVEVAAALGLDAVCVLTDATRPFQPYVGRGEALVALRRVIEGTEEDWLGGHLADCATMAGVVGGAASGAPDRASIAVAAIANMDAQGGSLEALRERAAAVERGHVRTVASPAAGVLAYDLSQLRSAVGAAQGATGGPGWPDEAGVVLLARPRSAVAPGETLMTVRCPDRAWPAMRDALAAAVRFGHAAEAPRGVILGVVGV